MHKLIPILILFLNCWVIATEQCVDLLGQISPEVTRSVIEKICTQSTVMKGCQSQVKNLPIYHMDVLGNDKNPKKILVFAMFHGDENPSGYIALNWMSRLQGIKGRNTWRVIPLVNPDGFLAKTRNNGRGVDINRNLPTQKWEIEAKERWKVIEKENPRRFPGEVANSESETKCILSQLDDFKPDFVISLHTPYGLLDFDGPENINFALKSFKDMPWKRLGHYPGSLGRYMWAERNTPVLTIELKGNQISMKKSAIDFLQDTLGSFAIRLLTKFDKQSMISSAK